MRVVSWNVHRANARKTPVWDYLREIDPDITLLQEVGSLPETIRNNYEYCLVPARTMSGGRQKFHTGILSKGTIGEPVELSCEWDWVNRELDLYSGNLVAREVSLTDGNRFRVMSAYSPAWPIDSDRLAGVDVTSIKLKNNPKLWVTELFWAALKGSDRTAAAPWIAGGDLNSSPTFDDLWGDGPRGNREILERMAKLGFTECLAGANGRLVPTFFNHRGGKVIHQMDHVFVNGPLIPRLKSCEVGGRDRVFGGGLSDHLPIIAEFV